MPCPKCGARHSTTPEDGGAACLICGERFGGPKPESKVRRICLPTYERTIRTDALRTAQQERQRR